MNIFDYAMQMEKDGEELYRDLAQKSGDEGIKRIFNMLADDEVKHYRALEDMKKEKEQEITDTTVLSDAKNIFSQLKEEGKFEYELPQLELYKKAQDLEKKTESFYREKAEEAGKEYQKEMLLKIAEEEKKHYFLLDNMIEFVSRPQTWLENAEFYHLEDY